MIHAPAEAHPRKKLLCPAPCFRNCFPRDPERHHHVLERGELAKEVVKLKYETHRTVAKRSELLVIQPVDGLTTDDHITATRPVERAEHMQERGLAGAAGTDDRHHLARADGEIHSAQHVDRAAIPADVRLVKVVRFEYGHGYSCLIASIG